MNQSVDGGECHRGIWEYLIPAREGLIGGQRQALPFIALGNQLEQDRGFRLVPPNVAQVVEDQQVKAIHTSDLRREPHFASRHLQPLHQIAGAREADSIPTVDQTVTMAGSGRPTWTWSWRISD